MPERTRLCIKTTATRDGDHYVIKGRKVWTSKAEQSQKCLLLTRTTPIDQCKKKSDGMTLFLADLDPKYVTIRPIPKMGREAVGSCEVFYDELRVHEFRSSWRRGQGLPVPARRPQCGAHPGGRRSCGGRTPRH